MICKSFIIRFRFTGCEATIFSSNLDLYTMLWWRKIGLNQNICLYIIEEIENKQKSKYLW